jgi:CheY-like chemotaxis protein
MTTNLDENVGAPRILVADDEPQILSTLAILLEAEGWHVVQAESGDEALERCRRESFDVVVLDYMMPGMNGLQVTRFLQFEGIWMPTILFTAYLVAELKATCDDLGVVAVDKINWDELVLRCRELCEKNSDASGSASARRPRNRLLQLGTGRPSENPFGPLPAGALGA